MLAADHRLEHLDLTDERALYDREAEQIAAADLPSLRMLEIKFANLTGAGLCTLVAAPRLPRLRALDVVYNKRIGAAGLGQLAALPGLARIEMLNLQGCDPGVGGLQALAHSPHARGLRELRLSKRKQTAPWLRWATHIRWRSGTFS